MASHTPHAIGTILLEAPQSNHIPHAPHARSTSVDGCRMVTRHGHAAWSRGMVTRHGHAAWSRGMVTRHGHAAWSRGMVTRHGHAAWSRGMVTRHGHAAWSRGMVTRHGHAAWSRLKTSWSRGGLRRERRKRPAGLRRPIPDRDKW